MGEITKYNTPIYNYLKEYAEQGINIFHMPGHKLAKGMPPELTCNVLQLDVTEVEGTDNLHYPEGIIKQAQQLAAKAFGAEKTYFLVNGSTCGIQAAIMSVCARGQKIIIGRDSHKSVVSGLILSGAEPVFAYPEYNTEFGITEGVSAESIEATLNDNPDATAVLITRPNYYGICCDIGEISKVVHSHNKLLIVDEAHGAHLNFNQELPAAALVHQADICIQSAHKTLPAVTQGAYLHIKGSRVDKERLEFNLGMLQSSSPSYIIMSYLDIARELMEQEGAAKLDRLLKDVEWLKNEINTYTVYKILTKQDISSNNILDPTRMVINVSKLGISGYQAEKLLREKYNTQVEMADNENLVLITTIADNHETFSRLAHSLKLLAHDTPKDSHSVMSPADKGLLKESEYSGNIKKVEDGFSDLCMTSRSISTKLPWEAYSEPKEEVLLEESSGRICAGLLTPYPPGIPVLYPGEIIYNHQINYIAKVIHAGGRVNGICRCKYVQVLK